MATTTKMLLTFLEASQAQKHVTVNEALRRLDALVQVSVIDRDLTTPPGSPADGDTYIPAATATGDWTGAENKVVYWDAQPAEWKIVTPFSGWRAYIQDETVWIYWDGATWQTHTAISITGRAYGDALLDKSINRVQVSGPGVASADMGGSEATYVIRGGIIPILDMSLTAPPGSPAVDDMYIPAATATGAWAGQENKIARWYDDTVNSGWEFFTPLTHMRIRDVKRGWDMDWDGSAWIPWPRRVRVNQVSTQSISAATTTRIVFTGASEVFDYGGWFDSAVDTGKLIVPNGIKTIEAGASIWSSTSGTSNNDLQLSIYLNGSPIATNRINVDFWPGPLCLLGPYEVTVDAADELEMYLFAGKAFVTQTLRTFFWAKGY